MPKSVALITWNGYCIPCSVNTTIDDLFATTSVLASKFVATQRALRVDEHLLHHHAMRSIYYICTLLHDMPLVLLDTVVTSLGRARIGVAFITHLQVLHALGISLQQEIYVQATYSAQEILDNVRQQTQKQKQQRTQEQQTEVRHSLPPQVADMLHCMLRMGSAMRDKRCAFCYEPSKQRCAQCKTRYCSRDHQRAHWAHHKPFCCRGASTDHYVQRMVDTFLPHALCKDMVTAKDMAETVV